MQTIKGFIAKHGIRMNADWADSNPNMTSDPEWERQASHWKCTFRKSGDQRRQMTTYYSMGAAHTGEPKADSVLDCLASDAGGIENAAGRFEDWASEYGYDTDSRKAEATFKACERAADKLKRFLGEDAYKVLLWETERE